MKTLIATLIVSSFALTGGAFAEKQNTNTANVEASSTNGTFSGLNNDDIDALFYEPVEQ
ncbi:MAG: hypothetical protein ABJN04_08380 [Hyphomicrobiales bacterium]